MIQIIGWLACGVVLIVGHTVCIVLASGRRARTADALSAEEFEQRAQRLWRAANRATAEEMVVYRNALSEAMRGSRVEREAEAVAAEAWR